MENIIISKKVFFISIICIVIATSLVLNVAMFFAITKGQQILQQCQTNKKVLEFRNMFSEKVLIAEKEIDFDTRLSLESAVRNLNDQDVFDQWEKFTNCQTKEDATIEAKKLLKLLIAKTSN